jgi:hypothetical protein
MSKFFAIDWSVDPSKCRTHPPKPSFREAFECCKHKTISDPQVSDEYSEIYELNQFNAIIKTFHLTPNQP